ncbi:site-specific DNA-methyltransferase [Ligilactobacillus equi]|uniref:Type III restriction-modification system: methylase n=1 Tax=Ligilactobacillus equi DPC 6820 TaxID=1392007 RepID=V7I0P6_9LACO|nr:site-specific DNA-methyltransferase [Ligilactobacillus equi]ETA75018.1 type III restriction-modification system: methylase [Ligilactobacillus equi DPC 6820]
MVETIILKELRNVVESFGNKYVTEDGVLKKDSIISDLDKYNQDLIEAILKNKVLNENYVESVIDTKIIKVEEIIQALEQDEYWINSYTKYANKIGLTSNGRYLDETSDIVLDFPYKDSVLKGGMTKEDEKNSNESFLNEIIAKEEIDVLLDNKIFKNVIKYDKNGESTISEIKDTDNLIIKGNNLIALHSLKSRYSNKIKMIYIDVPYYFKKRISEDAFKYNSNFKLSTWLTFLKSRLEIAKQLLSTNGSLWINISDDGMHYLKVLSDSIFGADKFLGTIPRKTRNGKSDVPFNMSQDFDWLLVYSKASEKDEVVGRSVDRKYYTTDDFPGRPWRVADLTSQRTIEERPNSDFTMINPKTGKKYPVNPKRSWAVTKDTFDEWYSNGGIGFPDDYEFMNGERPFRRVFKDEDDKKKKSYVSTDLLIKLIDKSTKGNYVNKHGNDQITELFDRDSFGYAKPEQLLKAIVEATTNEGDIVLDFFMGSATTQAVAMKMNRQFIGVEQMDYINTVSVPRLQKVIGGEQGGISKDVNWQGSGSFIYAELLEKNAAFVNAILNARNTEELKVVFDKMKNIVDFDFRVDLQNVVNTVWDEDFETQKKILVDIIDKNQLYYNYSEIDDEEVKKQLSKEEYEFNKSFYSLEDNALEDNDFGD